MFQHFLEWPLWLAILHYCLQRFYLLHSEKKSVAELLSIRLTTDSRSSQYVLR